MKLTQILKLAITEDVLERLGFSDYDDENCTWGNRRLNVRRGLNDKWPDECYVLQIIDYGDFPEDNGAEFNDCFYYAGWFELLKQWQTKDGWHLNTVKDLYKIIYLYHNEYLHDFKEILKKLK